MPPITHVFVKVPDPKEDELPRLVPVPSSDGVAAGGAQLRCEPGKLYRLPWSTFTRKRIAAGDFVLATKDGKAAKDAHAADASGFVRIAPDGTVDADQRSDEEIAKVAELAAAKAKIESSHKPAPAADVFDTKGKA